MIITKKRVFFAFIAFIQLLLFLPGTVSATEEDCYAEDISGMGVISDATGFYYLEYLFNGDTAYVVPASSEISTMTLSHQSGLGSVYLIFRDIYGSYTVTDNATGETHQCGLDGFYHEFIDLEAIFGTAPTSVTFTFDHGKVRIFEMSVFTPGQVPEWVQKWEHPVEGKTDLMLFSTHGDDEHLFFTGALPYYAIERGYQVQVVYLTDHRGNNAYRVHEMLNGLWAVGVHTYPTFGTFPDFLTYDLAACYDQFRLHGFEQEDIVNYIVEHLRRYKPTVVLAHDFDGEYGNGHHMVYADAVSKALTQAADEENFPESAAAYGTWDVPKAYFHLYQENAIHMNWDIPMESFGGMTPYQVSKELGWPCHKSQQKSYNRLLRDFDTADAILEYSPCDFGLYRSTVGPDVEKTDFFENVTTYSDLVSQTELVPEDPRSEDAPAAEATPSEPVSTQSPETQAPSPEPEPETTVPSSQPQTPGMAPVLCAAGAAILLILFFFLRFRKKK